MNSKNSMRWLASKDFPVARWLAGWSYWEFIYYDVTSALIVKASKDFPMAHWLAGWSYCEFIGIPKMLQRFYQVSNNLSCIDSQWRAGWIPTTSLAAAHASLLRTSQRRAGWLASSQPVSCIAGWLPGWASRPGCASRPGLARRVGPHRAS